MSSTSNDSDVICDIILKNNLELIDNTYIILNVVDNESRQVQTMCIGEIDSFQTYQEKKDSLSTASVTSELSTDN
ncbi:lef10 [Hemileuca sp. nucleopolyhedrovirus]|uniref:Lef10 n=1 Tax=Hemileuca sp. nucleopolyhedrovirus TaxID=1367203 RepID=S5N363_9ABAC|nr:lef10 [Hemileuca sp. nucleopolyhedrovirus]AGR56795.1 lef10 [Hemileuca sp. nucleopolyhedrovirus]